eukprot:NODE_14681_length_1093_cov_4.761905.p1 GENE.NODE_14681_length_1093_cov_4.761905~~NODE_14681_length_1093_cov_4.761905.p1  ORF type:complete len:231 (+),score=31.20 NODE_14681_length_1093_cov_4.761905:389-1081(+)
MRALRFKRQLRICNSYPSSSDLNITLDKTTNLTMDSPMPYRSCRNFLVPLQAGDQLEFSIAGVVTGTFAVYELPNNDAVLVLVIYRHSILGNAVAFQSHVFANLFNAQVAVINTYRGSQNASIHVKDRLPSTQHRDEALSFNTVAAMNPGLYQVELDDPAGKRMRKSDLVVLNRESYVVLVSGIDPIEGQSFPQDITIFPNSDVNALPSGARAKSGGCALFLMLLLLLWQ